MGRSIVFSGSTLARPRVDYIFLIGFDDFNSGIAAAAARAHGGMQFHQLTDCSAKRIRRRSAGRKKG